MVNLVEQTGTDTTTTTTTTKPRSPSPPAEPATDVSNLQTSLFPSTVPTVAEANAADSRFPLFLDQPASSSAPDSDNDDRISTNDPAGDDGDDDDDDQSGKRTHQDSALDRPRETRRVRAAISPVFLNGAVKKRCLRPPQATNALATISIFGGNNSSAGPPNLGSSISPTMPLLTCHIARDRLPMAL
uniref:Uncharacterized protein n=1 Tax=Anopheles coluzzii TaxID=1518534 RepID=A0A8W7P4H6_ANOCL